MAWPAPADSSPNELECLGRGVERAEPGVGEALEVEGAGLPHLVTGAREEPARLAQVGGALLEASQEVAQHHGAAHQHPPERDAV